MRMNTDLAGQHTLYSTALEPPRRVDTTSTATPNLSYNYFVGEPCHQETYIRDRRKEFDTKVAFLLDFEHN